MEHIAMVADITAMFHQVKVTPDQDVLWFLWWPDGDMSQQAKVYRMGDHQFGGSWSPSYCNFTLRNVAGDNREKYHPYTISIVHRNFYVDDCLKSVSTEEEAEWLYRELTGLLNKGGFT
ncbi:hypothetical protein HOLleu_28338 [Holothuria leucospilota]|uniref:Reverse transcriptase domain-containing protein n=1 Tax=Holothuria leucospilota TaxID=206669 RepID=A0A9Q1BM81_HOLLE|nr:hypothetical protein HOLleu_28338 [Holothuria leucospilota]